MAEDQAEFKLDDLMEEAGGGMPSKKQLLEMLEGSEMTEEMKEQLRSMLKGGAPEMLGSSSTLMAVLFVLIIFAVILFFGYKLYKSIKDKELKKEEKKRAKMQKKKK